jgi:hypothetical protein
MLMLRSITVKISFPDNWIRVENYFGQNNSDFLWKTEKKEKVKKNRPKNHNKEIVFNSVPL